MRYHPAAQILAWCLLVAALQIMTPGALFVATGSVLICALLLCRLKFMQLMRRTRWIMVSLLAIYAFSTPGEPITGVLGLASPTREGLSDGAMQLARLVAALASLALVLERLSRQQLIAGIHTLLAPLQWLGISRERFALRLALTLHYAEVAVSGREHDWRKALHGLFEHPHGAEPAAAAGDDAFRRQDPATGIFPGGFELPTGRFTAGDMLLLGGAVLLLWLVLE